MHTSGTAKWVLLAHQIPAHPSAVRVRVWRRLQEIGAISVRKAVYALPSRPECVEDLQWLRQEILDAGGEATVFVADAVDGAQDEEIIRAFQAARDVEYGEALEDLSGLEVAMREDSGSDMADTLSRLRQRLETIAAIDFFEASRRVEALAACRRCEALQATDPEPHRIAKVDASGYRKRRWVTRKGLHIDRLASAWLIRRYIDPEARFAFVKEGSKLHKQDVPFDMFGVEFGHHGDHCTFETLVLAFALDEAALTPLARIVHDADLKDGKFGRRDVEGIEKSIRALGHQLADAELLEVGLQLFDGLVEVVKQEG